MKQLTKRCVHEIKGVFDNKLSEFSTMGCTSCNKINKLISKFNYVLTYANPSY